MFSSKISSNKPYQEQYQYRDFEAAARYAEAFQSFGSTKRLSYEELGQLEHALKPHNLGFFGRIRWFFLGGSIPNCADKAVRLMEKSSKEIDYRLNNTILLVGEREELERLKAQIDNARAVDGVARFVKAYQKAGWKKYVKPIEAPLDRMQTGSYQRLFTEIILPQIPANYDDIAESFATLDSLRAQLDAQQSHYSHAAIQAGKKLLVQVEENIITALRTQSAEDFAALSDTEKARLPEIQALQAGTAHGRSTQEKLETITECYHTLNKQRDLYSDAVFNYVKQQIDQALSAAVNDMAAFQVPRKARLTGKESPAQVVGEIAYNERSFKTKIARLEEQLEKWAEKGLISADDMQVIRAVLTPVKGANSTVVSLIGQHGNKPDPAFRAVAGAYSSQCLELYLSSLSEYSKRYEDILAIVNAAEDVRKQNRNEYKGVAIGADIEQDLIEPVQRLTRIAMQLKELASKTDGQASEIASIRVALADAITARSNLEM